MSEITGIPDFIFCGDCLSPRDIYKNVDDLWVVEECEYCGDEHYAYLEQVLHKCSFDPQTYGGASIGMFHCPECGEMVVAGMPHPDYSVMNR